MRRGVLLVLALAGIAGLWATNVAWLDKVWATLVSTFTFVVGLALGRGGRSPDGKTDA